MGDMEQSAGMVMPGWGREVGPGKAPWGLEVQAPLQKRNQKVLSTPLPDVLGVGKASLSQLRPVAAWLCGEGRAWGSAVEVPTGRAHGSQTYWHQPQGRPRSPQASVPECRTPARAELRLGSPSPRGHASVGLTVGKPA